MSDRSLAERFLMGITGLLTGSREDVEEAIRGESLGDELTPPSLLESVQKNLGFVSKSDLHEIEERLSQLEDIVEELPPSTQRRKRGRREKAPSSARGRGAGVKRKRGRPKKTESIKAEGKKKKKEKSSSSEMNAEEKLTAVTMEAELVPVEEES